MASPDRAIPYEPHLIDRLRSFWHRVVSRFARLDWSYRDRWERKQG